MKIVEESRHHG